MCVFHPLMAEGLGRALSKTFPALDVRVVSDTARDPPSRDEIELLVANRFPPGLLGRMASLRWLQLTSVGTEQVRSENPGSDVLITSASDVPAVAVAEFVWMGILALAKQAPLLFRQQRERLWRLPDSTRIAGSTLVLLGLGNIGREVARRASAHGIRVLAVTRTGRPSPLAERTFPASQLSEVIGLADHFVMAIPSVREGGMFVGAELIARMRPSAVLINVARADVLDASAVVAALREGRLKAALLDVHDPEPLPADSPLWDVEGLWITPHCAFKYQEHVDDLAALCIDNLGRYLSGQRLRNLRVGERTDPG